MIFKFYINANLTDKTKNNFYYDIIITFTNKKLEAI